MPLRTWRLTNADQSLEKVGHLCNDTQTIQVWMFLVYLPPECPWKFLKPLMYDKPFATFLNKILLKSINYIKH